MKISDEASILDQEFRAKVILEIESPENVDRKQESKRRYDLYKDFTKFYVLDRIKREMSADTALIVSNRVSNVSITKKIINKKAQVYKDGVVRQCFNPDGTINQNATEQVQKLYGMVGINSIMKKTNRWNELQKNASNQFIPYQCPVTGKWKFKLSALSPFLYDVIEDEKNPEMPLVYIFSYFTKQNTSRSYLYDTQTRNNGLQGTTFRTGDYKDQIIADSPEDKNLPKKFYIWWSYNYHFTTDEKGIIISINEEGTLENPFKVLPFTDFSRYQDGQYWALGGDDIADGSILINMLLTDVYYIQMFQGFGYFYAWGKNIPDNFQVSPRKGLIIKVEEGDPTPSVGFANAGDNIEPWLKMIEQALAFLLSTNDLEPGTIQGQLSATNAESGVQEIIKRSINTDDIEDQQQIYKDGESKQYKVISTIFNYYYDKGLLVDELMEIGRLDETVRLVAKFTKPTPYMNEKEKLEVIKMREELALDTKLESIMRDNPDLSEVEAQAKLDKLNLELQKNKKEMMGDIIPNIETEDETEDEEEKDNLEDKEED